MKARLRIGVDFHEWDGIFQGSRSHVLGLYREAIRLAPDIDFIFFLQGTASLAAAWPEFRAANVRLVRMAGLPGPVRLGWVLPWLRWRHGIDVLHTQYRLPLWRTGPCVCTIHDVLVETHPQFFAPGFVREASFSGQLAARGSRVLFTVSEYSRREICGHYGVDPAKVKVTFNGVDRQRFHPGAQGAELVRALGLTPGHYVLSVGRLEPRKNQQALIEAWLRLAEEAQGDTDRAVPDLVLVGQIDRNFPEVGQALKRASKQARVFQLSGLDDAQLPAVMRHARLFAYPAFAEGFGMPVLEAMASGVPVITSNTTSLPEVAGEAAWQISPQNTDELAAALRQALAQTAAERQATVEAGLARADRFSWEASARVLLQGLKEAAGAPQA